MADLSQIPTEELMRMIPQEPARTDLSRFSTEELMQMRSVPEKPGYVEDVVKSLPGAIPRAASALVGLPQTIMELIGKGAGKGFKAAGIDPAVVDAAVKPEFGNVGDVVTRGYDKISEMFTGKPVYTPQTGPGRVADLMAQTVVAGPGSLGQKAAIGGAAGVSGEAARAVLDNPIAIGVAQMLGGGAASLAFILKSIPAQNINDAIKHIKPGDLQKAQALMDDAARMGTPITGAEAIAQVTGKNTLQDIQRVVESSRFGGPVVQPMMNARPEANRQAFGTKANAIAPRPTNPAETPVNMQEAAQGAITEARQAGNTRAKPYYDQAATQKVGPSDWNSLTQDPAITKALNAVRNDPIWGVTNEPAGSVKWIDAAKRWIDDQAQGAAPSEQRIWQQANTQLKTVADAASPAYAQARGIVAQNQQQVVKPMQNSPVGGIADTGAAPGMPRPSGESMMSAQSNILMPQTPKALDPPTIHRTVATLNKQNPEAAREWTRQNLQAHFDEATQKLVAGENQWGGAKFASQIAGNPSQKDNLQALVESVSDRQTWNGFNRFLEVLEAQGKRHAPGSQTSQNAMVESHLSKGQYGAALATVGSPGRLTTVVYDWYQNFKFGQNSEKMARILTDPKSVDLMRKLAKEAPTSNTATALVAQIIASQPLSQPPSSADEQSMPTR